MVTPIADETETSTVTIEHAYALLCDEGYVEPREQVDFLLSSGIQTASRYPRMLRLKMTRFLAVSPNKGCVDLRIAIKHYLSKNRDISVDIEQIIIGSGAEYFYGLIIELLGRNRTYGIESPSYKKIEQAYKAYEVSYEKLRLSNDGIDSVALAKAKESVLHTTPYRSYPTGVSASASKRHEYIRWASIKERYIVEDDFEWEFSVSTKPEDTLFSLSDRDNVIYLNTFPKTISPSLRVGYMVLPKRLMGEFEKRLGFYSCTIPTFE